jgi:hypothetical protein
MVLIPGTKVTGLPVTAATNPLTAVPLQPTGRVTMKFPAPVTLGALAPITSVIGDTARVPVPLAIVAPTTGTVVKALLIILGDTLG